jgi:isopenicillin-N N-acyltransferase-like protein
MTTPCRLAIAAIFLFLPLAPLSAQDAAKPIFRYREARHGGAELKYYGKIPVLAVAGSPEEVGGQIGTLQAAVVKNLQGSIEGYVRFRGWNDVYPWILKAGALLEWNFPRSHRAEFSSAMKAAQVDRELLILINTAFDVVSAFACSTLVAEPARSETGALLFGRNLDLPPFANLHELALVTVYRTQGKRAFASVGFPGQFGVISGMNDAGLCVAVNEILETKDASAKFNPLGTPKLLLLRRVLEECATLDDAEKLIAAATRTGMMAVTVCDQKESAVLEITTKSVVRRRPDAGICTCTNHFRTKELGLGDKCDRLDALDASRAKAKLTIDDVGQALHAANFGELTMQTMIFEPAALRLHLAFGRLPSSAQPRETLELGPLLTPRPAINELRK